MIQSVLFAKCHGIDWNELQIGQTTILTPRMMCFSRGFGSMQTWDHCRVALQMSHLCPTYVPQVWDWESLSGMQSTRKDFGESHWFQPVHSNWNCDSSAMSSVAVISHFSSQSQFRILYHTLSLINLHTAKTCCDVGKPARVTLRCLHTSVSIFQLRPDSP